MSQVSIVLRRSRCLGAQLNTLCTAYNDVGGRDVHTSAAQPDQEPEQVAARRFWKETRVHAVPGKGFQVLLDNRELKSPAGHPLVLPTRPLALALAGEWEQQDPGTLRPFTMPLMTLASTAIDEPKLREKVIESLLQYLHTDSACCRDEPGPLADRQAQVYGPVIEWAEQEMGVEFAVGSDLIGMEQPPELLERAKAYLLGLDAWQLAAADFAASTSRSVLVGLALVKGQLSLPAALIAARVEEDYQIEAWGLVEGGHDIDIADTSAKMSAAALFSRAAKA